MMETTAMTLGEKIKSARKAAGMTQEQLAGALSVSRQAITKWESDKGMPDIENLKRLAQALGVSLDYLLNDGTSLDMRVLREEIVLTDGGLLKKAAQKDALVREKFPDGEIHRLMMEQVTAKAEKVVDNLLGFLTDAPFGIPQFLNGMKHIHTNCYLVNEGDKQYLVMVTDEFLERRQLAARITEKQFEIGSFRFTNRGPLPQK